MSIAWWSIVNVMPHPLGDKLEYLGKEDYGNIFGFDSYPYSIYYYGTNMSEEEVKAYFGGVAENTGEVAGDGYSGEDLRFNSGTGDSFEITYYKKTETYLREIAEAITI